MENSVLFCISILLTTFKRQNIYVWLKHVIAFIEHSPNAGLSQVLWEGSPWYDGATPIWPP